MMLLCKPAGGKGFEVTSISGNLRRKGGYERQASVASGIGRITTQSTRTKLPNLAPEYIYLRLYERRRRHCCTQQLRQGMAGEAIQQADYGDASQCAWTRGGGPV